MVCVVKLVLIFFAHFSKDTDCPDNEEEPQEEGKNYVKEYI